jgi:aspartate/methionine/tyrosine aminotransferase
MQIRNFETEDFFAKYEFTKPYLISASDCESVSIAELIRLGGGSVEAFLQTKLSYPEMSGSENLRSEIAATYQSADPSQILVLGSPIEGIYLTMRALLEKGDHVVILSPAYDALFNVAEHVSGNVSRWFLTNDGKRWHLDFEQLEQLLTPKTKLLVLNFPHNPTGFIPSLAELDRILKIANQHGITIFSDEIYRGLEYGENRIPSLLDLDNKAIVLSGASKSLGLPGLRFGWLATKNATAYKKLHDFKIYTSMCSTQAGEYLGLMALRAAPQLVKKNLAIIKQNLLIAEKFFAKWNDRFAWLKPMAGSVSLMKLKQGSAEAFCLEMADHHGIVLLPAKFMGYEDSFARLGFGRTNFQLGLEAFDKALSLP